MKRKIVFGFLILSLLSCNYVTQMIIPPTATPTPTATATITALPTPTLTPIVPAFIPPQCASAPIATVAPDTFAQPTLEPAQAGADQPNRVGPVDRIADDQVDDERRHQGPWVRP